MFQTLSEMKIYRTPTKCNHNNNNSNNNNSNNNNNNSNKTNFILCLTNRNKRS